MVELAVSLPLIGMVVTVFLAMLLSSMQTVSRDRIQLELNTSNQIALDIIERDVRYSASFNTSVPSQFNDPYGATGLGVGGANAWSHKGVPASITLRVLLLRSYATTTNPYALDRKNVFVNGSVTNLYATTDSALNCTTKLNVNPKLPYYTVYFVRNGNLYRRILIDNNPSSLCSAPGNSQYQKLSCPPESRSTWNSACQTQDELIASNVDKFQIEYYQRDEDNPTIFTNISDAYTSSNPDVLVPARDADIKLTLKQLGEGKTMTSTLELRASKVNEL